jgi:predicted RNA-binding protein (virulence factor B family)
MKKLTVLLTIIVLSLSLFGFSSTHKHPLIKQSYTVVDTLRDHVTAINKQYPNEALDFFYDDMKHKTPVYINDKITAYFYKDSKGEFHIEDWKRDPIKYDVTKFKVTKVIHSGFYCENNKQKNLYLSNQYLVKGTKLHKGDTVNVYSPHDDNGMSEISKIVKVN